jgi:hypothetical protein
MRVEGVFPMLPTLDSTEWSNPATELPQKKERLAACIAHSHTVYCIRRYEGLQGKVWLGQACMMHRH